MPEGSKPIARLDDFLVGDWLAEPALCRLSRRGSTVRLRPQLMDLLVCLARHAGRVVSKDEILAEVWSGQFIAESGLSRAVAELRQALHDDPREPVFIETIAKRGYRLIAPVRYQDAAPAPIMNAAPVPVSDAAAAPVPVPSLPASSRASSLAPLGAVVRRHWVALMTLAMVAASVLIVLSLRTPALTETDRVVLCFENQTGEPVFDRTLQLALAVQLEQSPFLRVVSEEQVRDALRLMGREADAALTRPLAVEVCRRQGARAMIAGSIGRVANRYVLGLEGVACESGDVLAREQAQVAGKDRVLDALGGMVPALRRRLGESLASVQRNDVPITRATTGSLEALGAASLGDLERRRGRYEAAAAHYRRAIAADPSFALAYTRLGSVASWMGNTREATACVSKAYELRERASVPERLEIEARYHQGVTGEFTAAAAALEELRHSHPRAPMAHFGLALIYSETGRFREALAAAREAVRLEPGGNRENVQLARAFLYLNRFDEARQAAEASARRGNDAFDLHGVLFDIAFATGDTAGLARERAWAAKVPEARALFLVFEAEAAAYAGKLRLARTRLEEVRALARERGDREGELHGRFIEAGYEALLGEPAAARTIAAGAVAEAPTPSGEGWYAAALLALAGETGIAERIVEAEAPAGAPPPGEAVRVLRTSALAAIEVGHGRHARAIDMQTPLIPVELGVAFGCVPAIVRATALLRGGRARDALGAFETVLAHTGLDPSSEMLPIARLGAARARKLAGDAAGARAAYDALLTLWAEADPDLPLLQAARQERQMLEPGTTGDH